jgi:transposase
MDGRWPGARSSFVSDDMIRTWAPDDFWHIAQPLIPVAAARPQGGGKRRADDRAVLAAIVYLVQAGCSWRKLPARLFGVSRPTVHRAKPGRPRQTPSRRSTSYAAAWYPS